MFYNRKIGKTFYTFFSPLTLDNILASFLSSLTFSILLYHNSGECSLSQPNQSLTYCSSPSISWFFSPSPSLNFFAHKATTLSSTSPILHNPSYTDAHPLTDTNHNHRCYQPLSRLFLAQTHLPVSFASSLGFN